jgi:pimeloyl-ACP methyl ester carboxylesterase
LTYSLFTPSHRGGSGSPLVCLRGFMDTWRIWELVLPALERHHDVLALTLLGHAGGPPLEGEFSAALLPDAIERAMDDAGFETALREGYILEAERIACPVRIVWGTEDRLLPWPSTAARFRNDWLPHADWIELEGIGHCPPLDIPLETAQLVLGFTGG